MNPNYDKIRDCLVETLSVEAEAVLPDCSLLDDLGAESIDLIDLTFRLSKSFGIKLTDQELFKGDLDLVGRGMVVSGTVTEAGMQAIRARMPGFDLSRFAGGKIYSGDLPRLITPATLLGAIERRLAGAGPA